MKMNGMQDPQTIKDEVYEMVVSSVNPLETAFAQIGRQATSDVEKQAVNDARTQLRDYVKDLAVIYQGKVTPQALDNADERFRQVIGWVRHFHAQPHHRETILEPGLNFKNAHESISSSLRSLSTPAVQPQQANVPNVPVASMHPSPEAAMPSDPTAPDGPVVMPDPAQVTSAHRESFNVEMQFDASGRPVLEPIDGEASDMTFDQPSISIPAPKPSLRPSQSI